MKVLFIAEFFPKSKELLFTGGVEAYNYFLVKELSKKHQVVVICRRTSDREKDEILENLKIVRVGLYNPRIDASIASMISRAAFLAEGLKWGLKQEFDIVQGNNFVTYPLAFLLGFFKKKPSVAWYPDVFIGKWFKLFGFFSGFAGEITERVSLLLPWAHFISLSNSTKTKLIRVGIKNGNITTIYAGVDFNFFQKIKVKKSKEFTISCVARLVSYKRVDLLIKASKLLIDKNYRIRVEIIGDGPEKNNLENLIKKLNIEKWVSINSGLSRSEMGSRVKSSHLFCLPSEEEGFGLVILEAAACGVPFVVSDLDVLKEVTRKQGGLFFKSGSIKDLENKIIEYKRSKRIQEKYSKEALKLAKLYNWEDIGNQFDKVYHKIIQKPLRIIMFVDAWFPHVGGGQVHVWELSKQLVQKGCLVTIYTRDLGKWTDNFPGVNVKRIGHFKKFANIFGRLEYLVYAFFYSLFASYDILHAHAFSPGLIAPFIKFFRNKPTVYTVHGKGAKIAGLGFGEGFLEDLVTYKIPYDLEITVARNTITKKVAAKKIIIIPNGIDINKFIPARRVRKEIKNILYIGRLSYEKGADILLDVFKRVDNNKLKLTIVGDGEQKEFLNNQAKGLNVDFKGVLYKKNLVDIYRKTDLLVIPSRSEGHPLVLFEAWAAKLPVLATKVGDNGRYIKEGVNGFLSKPDLKSLTNSLKKVLKNKSLNKIIVNGEKNVKNYSWDIIADKTLNNYRKII